MTSSTTDKVEGELKKAKGGVKETVGDITNNENMEAEGSVDKERGRIQKKKGEIKDALD